MTKSKTQATPHPITSDAKGARMKRRAFFGEPLHVRTLQELANHAEVFDGGELVARIFVSTAAGPILVAKRGLTPAQRKQCKAALGHVRANGLPPIRFPSLRHVLTCKTTPFLQKLGRERAAWLKENRAEQS